MKKEYENNYTDTVTRTESAMAIKIFFQLAQFQIQIYTST